MKYCTLSFLVLLFVLSISELSAQYDPDPTRFESSILNFEKLDSINPPKQGKLLFLGSSSIRYWDTAEEKYASYDALNRGFGGSQTSDVLYYFDRVVKPYMPSMIVFYEGDNDLNHGKSVEEVLRDYKTFLAKVKALDVKTQVVFIPAKPSPSRWELKPKYDTFNRALKELAATEDRWDYVDFWSPLIGQNDKPEPTYYISDSLHLNESGYAVWDSLMAEYLKGK